MKNNIKVSVIVPIYNVQEYIEKCVESIINQTYENLEIILVNDGSTDESGKLCDQFSKRDMRIKVIHQKNRGLSGARNSALEMLEGEYVCFIDGDDWIAHNMVERLLDAAIEYKADVVSCEQYLATDDKILKRIIYHGRGIKVVENENVLREIIDTTNHSVCNKMISSVLLRSVRFVEGALFEDVFFSCLYGKLARKMVIIPEPMYFYRTREGSISKEPGIRSSTNYFYALVDRYEYLCDMKDPLLKVSQYLSINSCYLEIVDKASKDEETLLLKLADQREKIRRDANPDCRKVFAVRKGIYKKTTMTLMICFERIYCCLNFKKLKYLI